jgi:lysophospholipase L1-like esterase
MRKILIVLFSFMCVFSVKAQNKDWASFKTYEGSDSDIAKSPVAVLIGDSITELWAKSDPAFFSDNNYICRGISGQVSSQILVRFRADALDLKPKVVVILAGTNDIALNEGSIPVDHVFDNIVSMAQLAKANGIVPIICSVTPSAGFSWRPSLNPVPEIREINSRLSSYAESNGFLYLDYYPSLSTPEGAFIKDYSYDGTHPTLKGYKIMESMLMPMISKALKLSAGYRKKAMFR